jgi:GDP-L-fucose synthase
MDKNSSICVLGGRGLVGSSILRKLNILGCSAYAPTSHDVDLLDQNQLYDKWLYNDCDKVFFSAAKVGGIQANINQPVEFGIINTQIILNVLHAAHRRGVSKLLFMGSSCIMPAKCEQPMKEDYFMTGPFEPTNEMYAFAKAFGVKLCQAYNKQYHTNFISCQPCNIYGQGDSFDPNNSHVVSALIQKFHNAKMNGDKEVICWGTGEARREVLYVDDLAAASVFLMDNYEEKDNFINVGTGEDHSISELAYAVRDIVEFKGDIRWDTSKPNGMMRKLLDVSKIHKLGWHHTTSLKDGIEKTYKWWLEKK